MPVWKLMPFLIKGREGKHEAGWITSELMLPLMRPGATVIFLGVHNEAAHFAVDVSILPRDGCPGPTSVDLGHRGRLIALDTEWWLDGGSKAQTGTGFEAGACFGLENNFHVQRRQKHAQQLLGGRRSLH
jgi:hypothetical protein